MSNTLELNTFSKVYMKLMLKCKVKTMNNKMYKNIYL